MQKPELPSKSGPANPAKLMLSYRALPAWVVPALLSLGISLMAIAFASNTDTETPLFDLKEKVFQANNKGLLSLFKPPELVSAPPSQLHIAPAELTTTPDSAPPPDVFDATASIQQALEKDVKVGDRLSALLLILGGLSLLLAFAGKDKRLYMDHSGINFPKGMAAPLGWKLKRSWSELSAIVLRQSTSASAHRVDTNSDEEIQLLFTSGKADIKCNRLSKPELESFFQALDELAPHCIRSPEVVAFRHKMFSDKDSHFFTQLWEEELASHFAATNFVALTPGQKLLNNKITVTMHLSSGGLSAVYLAEHNKSMAIVKESVVPPGTSELNREKASQMFQREASLLMCLDHPQIAKVFDHFQENGRDYLLLEYVPGVTLREYVRRHGPQSEERVINWTMQLADILGYLHGQDPPIIHRDITPDNLIITPDGRIVLIDFGAANQFLGAATGTIIGKQFYIAPEQFRGKAVPASDIYSLGGTIFYLLTGRDPDALMSSHPAKLNDKVSNRTDSIVASCTQPDASKRVSSAEALLELLAAEPGSAVENDSSEEGEAVSIKENEAVYG